MLLLQSTSYVYNLAIRNMLDILVNVKPKMLECLWLDVVSRTFCLLACPSNNQDEYLLFFWKQTLSLFSINAKVFWRLAFIHTVSQEWIPSIFYLFVTKYIRGCYSFLSFSFTPENDIENVRFDCSYSGFNWRRLKHSIFVIHPFPVKIATWGCARLPIKPFR